MQKDANHVELEKCCQTHIFLQNFVLIQPRTSPPKNCKILQELLILPILQIRGSRPASLAFRTSSTRPPPCPRRLALRAGAPVGDTTADRQNFGKMLLVFGCIGTDFCKKICVLQHFSKSTRFSSWNFWNLTKFCKFCDICNFLLKFHENCCFFKPIFCENFEIAAVQKDANLVELEKCCQTHIFLQNFVLIQPKTSPPKISKILLIFPMLLTLTPITPSWRAGGDRAEDGRGVRLRGRSHAGVRRAPHPLQVPP